ncbi:spore coat U domain-containing protein [Dyella tabacisoli]|uniref:Spore coat U domain-containing protein n=1 Tax=Dyella tabacisoli TaxID=2282381 RepID=A0A369UQC6_9GAMM|nr:spore coat U domain-containing protein [Dyella tabacisoli]RDD80519.1 spore coat U domain-containing protein [Dyella tabacisoli]
MTRKLICSALVLTLCTGSLLSPAYAAVYSNGTATATFLVSLTLQANCGITANPLNFGTTGVLTAAVNQSSTLSITCSNTTPYNIGLDAGTVAGSTVAARLMAGTTAGNTGTTVAFELYQDSGHLTLFGNTQGTNTEAGTGNGSAQTVTVYGQVPTQTTPKPDTYDTTVTATVYF